MMEILFLVLVGFSSCATVLSSQKSYHGYHLLSIPIRAEKDQAFITKLYESDAHVDIWSEPRQIGHNATLAVAPDNAERVMAALKVAGIEATVITTDLQGWMNTMKDSIASEATEPEGRRGGRGFQLNAFHTYDEIVHFMDVVSYACSRGTYHRYVTCEFLTIGQSYEGRDLVVLHIRPRNTTGVPGIWIDAGIHAREWAAPATAVYLIYKLLDTADEPSTSKLLTCFQWYIMPSANPDGYEYSMTQDRMWRKTRRPNPGSDCVGTDPNRNWDFHWNEVGASDDPCDDTFAGPAPFSEAETLAMSEFIMERKDELVVYLTLHAFGQYWLTPWGYTSDLPDDYMDLFAVAHSGIRAIRAVSGKSFSFGTSTNVLYAAAGGSDDWAKGVAGIKYSYTIEVRDEGWWGFMLPREEITSCGKEIWAGINAMAHKVLEHIDKGKVQI